MREKEILPLAEFTTDAIYQFLEADGESKAFNWWRNLIIRDNIEGKGYVYMVDTKNIPEAFTRNKWDRQDAWENAGDWSSNNRPPEREIATITDKEIRIDISCFYDWLLARLPNADCGTDAERVTVEDFAGVLYGLLDAYPAKTNGAKLTLCYFDEELARRKIKWAS